MSEISQELAEIIQRLELQKIDKLHEEACLLGKGFYTDPQTGHMVLTRIALEKRGECCNTGCRHCPYPKKKISPSKNEAQI